MLARAFGLNRTEHAVAHRHDQVAGRERDRTARVAQTVDDAQVRHVGVGHLGDQPGNAVRLIVLVGNFVAGCTRRVHQADDGQRAVGILFNALRGLQVVLGHPLAAAHGTVLGNEPHAPLDAVEVHHHHRRIERSVAIFRVQCTEPPDDVRRGYAFGILRACDHGFDIGVDIHVVEQLGLAMHVLVGHHSAQRRIEMLLLVGQQRRVAGEGLRDQKKPVVGWRDACHRPRSVLGLRASTSRPLLEFLACSSSYNAVPNDSTNAVLNL